MVPIPPVCILQSLVSTSEDFRLWSMFDLGDLQFIQTSLKMK
jgi:hypothetical protein